MNAPIATDEIVALEVSSRLPAFHCFTPGDVERACASAERNGVEAIRVLIHPPKARSS